MALAAGQVGCRNSAEIIAHGICQIGMRNRDAVRRIIGMTCITAYRLINIHQSISKRHAVGIHTHLIRHMRKIRRFAGKAIGQGMRSARRLNILHTIVVSASTAIIHSKPVSLINRFQNRVFLCILMNLTVFTVSHVTFIHIRIGVFPLRRWDYRDTRLGFHKIRTSRLAHRTQTQPQKAKAQCRHILSHICDLLCFSHSIFLTHGTKPAGEHCSCR